MQLIASSSLPTNNMYFFSIFFYIPKACGWKLLQGIVNGDIQ